MALTIEALQNIASTVKVKQQLTNWKTAIDAWSATVDSKTTGLTSGGNITVVASAATHAAGAIGTGAAPKTYIRNENGVIITQIKFDVQGLASVATANDVIGLAAGTPAAYLAQYLVATHGVVYKAELSCLETPTGGDNDINIVINSSATLKVGDAGGTTYVSGDSGDLLKGQTVQLLTPALTTTHYIYLTAGTGDVADTYTAGQYVLTLWGHAALA